MVIYGWGHTKTKDSGPTYPMKCNHCDNDVYFHLFKSKKYLTLFFIPVFPYETKWSIICPVCRTGYNISKGVYRELKPLSDVTEDFESGKISEEEYQKQLEEYKDVIEAAISE